MFRIRIITPAVTNEEGWRHAGGLLQVDGAPLPFLVDLTHWGIGDYERQWRAGVRRIVDGAPSAGLLTAYRGPDDTPHLLWALWRDEAYVYVQRQAVLTRERETPFDPWKPHPQVGTRTPSAGYGLPVPEWRVGLVAFLAGALGIRLPAFPF